MGAGEFSASRPGRITPVERPPVPIQPEYGWIQTRSGCFWDKKNLLFLAALEPRTDCTTQATTTSEGLSLTLKFHCY